MDVNPTLTATGVTHTGASLNLTRHGAAWWYKRTAGTPADATCHSVAVGTGSVGLSSLNEHTSYTYKVYDKTGCGSADEIASVTFHTGGDTLAASNITDGTATLTLIGHSSPWYVKRVTPAGDSTCKSKTSAQTTESLSGLRPGTQYVYTAHNNSACTHEIARETFTTLELYASDLDATKATLNLGNHRLLVLQGRQGAGQFLQHRHRRVQEGAYRPDRRHGLRLQSLLQQRLLRRQPAGHRRVQVRRDRQQPEPDHERE